MAPTSRPKAYTLAQIGALAAMGAVAVWGVAVLWLHMVTPTSAHVDEIVVIATCTLAYLILIPFYGMRVRWSYAAGVVCLLGLFVDAVVQAVEGILFFSVSFYNLVTLLVYVVAAAAIYFSVRAYRTLPSTPWWKTLVGVAGIVILAAVAYFILSSSKDQIVRAQANWTQNRIEKNLARRETLDEQIAYLADVGGLPSVAAGIVVNDELVWTGAYGGHGDVDTIYNIGSVTKPIVATAVLQLCERGLIDLDADVSDYLPFDVRHPEYPDVPITARMLLNHQSGLAHYTNVYFSYLEDEAILDWEQKHRGRTIYGDIVAFAPYPASYADFLAEYLVPGGRYYSPEVWSVKPGTEYAYSTTGYDLLGLVVEQVSGQPFSDYLKDHVFRPLDMASTGLSAADMSGRRAIPYDRVYGILTKTNVEFPLYERKRLGGGGLNSTVPDMAQFLIAHVNQGQVEGYQLLEPETVALMHSEAVKASGDIGVVGYGYGLNHMRAEPWQFYGHFYEFGSLGHGGTDYGYSSSMYFVEEEAGGYGFILLTDASKLFKQDVAWHFEICLKMENLLMQEARALYLEAGQ